MTGQTAIIVLVVTAQLGAGGIVMDFVDTVDDVVDEFTSFVHGVEKTSGMRKSTGSVNASMVYDEEINNSTEVLHQLSNLSSERDWEKPEAFDEYNTIKFVVTKDKYHIQTYTVEVSESNNGSVSVSKGVPSQYDARIEITHDGLKESLQVIKRVRNDSTLQQESGSIMDVYISMEISDKLEKDIQDYYNTDNTVSAVQEALVTGMSVPANTSDTDVTFMVGGQPTNYQTGPPVSPSTAAAIAVLFNVFAVAFVYYRVKT